MPIYIIQHSSIYTILIVYPGIFMLLKKFDRIS